MPENAPASEGIPRLHSKSSFDELFRSEYRQVLGLAYVLTGNWSAAEELTMDGFATALKNWNQVSILNSPGAWVRKVVSNAAVSRFRRMGAESGARSRLPDPPEHFASPVERSEVWDAVRRLPKRQAQSIALFYVAGYSRKEIAAMLGVSEESIKTHLVRGRQRLEKELG